jgi:diadenosine tetraphosphate (Ap4A) HIT family hydrolase
LIQAGNNPDASFSLDHRLAADTRPVVSLALCDVQLMNDARFGWLVLVPRIDGLSEIADLDDAQQAQLWHEVNLASAALRSCVPCNKLNIGALGNIVRQLHVHVVARVEGDAAWPGPVWGSGNASPYDDQAAADRLQALRHALRHATD